MKTSKQGPHVLDGARLKTGMKSTLLCLDWLYEVSVTVFRPCLISGAWNVNTALAASQGQSEMVVYNTHK